MHEWAPHLPDLFWSQRTLEVRFFISKHTESLSEDRKLHGTQTWWGSSFSTNGGKRGRDGEAKRSAVTMVASLHMETESLKMNSLVLFIYEQINPVPTKIRCRGLRLNPGTRTRVSGEAGLRQRRTSPSRLACRWPRWLWHRGSLVGSISSQLQHCSCRRCGKPVSPAGTQAPRENQALLNLGGCCE